MSRSKKSGRLVEQEVSRPLARGLIPRGLFAQVPPFQARVDRVIIVELGERADRPVI